MKMEKMQEEKNVIIEVEKEANQALVDSQKMIDKEIEYISHFTYANFDELLKMIFDNCSDISELESYIDLLKNDVIKNQNTLERMNYQKELTREDIINENIFNIYAVYNATVIGTYLLSGDPIEFIKKFLIVSLIGIASFKINLDYFTSDYRKKQIDKYVSVLDENIIIDKYNTTTLIKLKEMCINELKYQVMKLYEIVKNNNNYQVDYKRIDDFLKGIKIDFILEDSNVKAKIKKK